MSHYTVELERDVRKTLNAMRDMRLRLRNRIEAAILDLVDDPRPPGVKKMVGHWDLWRIRVEEWRVVYRVEDGRLVVVVVAVGGRGGVYGVV